MLSIELRPAYLIVLLQPFLLASRSEGPANPRQSEIMMLFLFVLFSVSQKNNNLNRTVFGHGQRDAFHQQICWGKGNWRIMITFNPPLGGVVEFYTEIRRFTMKIPV